MMDFDRFAHGVRLWQRRTFPGGTGEQAGRHLVEEAGELLAELERGVRNPTAVREEAADVLLLLIAVAGLAGFDLMAAAEDKMRENRRRKWETDSGAKGYRKHVTEDGDQ